MPETLRKRAWNMIGWPFRSWQVGLATIATLAVVYVGSLTLLDANQRALLFQNGSERIDPATRHLPEVAESIVTSADGTQVVVWVADSEPGKPTLIYFHGNAGVLGHRSWRFRWFLDQGWGLVGVAYRGSGGSTGSPGEAGFIADAEAVYDALPRLLSRPVDGKEILLYGESLGTGVALALATGRQVGGVVLETPYTSLEDAAQDALPFFPIRSFGLIRDRFGSLDRIDRINAPLLILHGTRDQVIPFAHAERLMERARDPKWARWYGGGRHHNLWALGAKDEIASFVARYWPGSDAGQPTL